MSLRKILKTRGSFPTDDATLKLIYLALPNITRRWTMPVKDWRAALNRFAIQYEERMPNFYSFQEKVISRKCAQAAQGSSSGRLHNAKISRGACSNSVA